MSHKYGFIGIRDTALHFLKTCIPSYLSLNNWAAFITGRSELMTMEIEDFLIAVNIARLTETHSLLPMALYACCTCLPHASIINGITRPNGVVERLSPEDIVLCMRGKLALLNTSDRAGSWLLDLACHPRCKNVLGCGEVLRSLPGLANDARTLISAAALGPTISHLRSIQEMLCEACWDTVIAKYKAAVSETFAMLPIIMGVEVDSWGVEDLEVRILLLL